MVKITYEVDGKKVSLNSFKDSIEQSILAKITEKVKNSIGEIQCSEHHEFPEITIKGKDSDSLSLDISGCCGKLVKDTTQKLE